MHWMTIDDQADLAGGLLEQALQGAHEQRATERAVKDHECQLPAVGARGIRVAAEPLTGGTHDRWQPPKRVDGPSHVIVGQPHLVTPTAASADRASYR